jgi:hypothetical protein
MKRHLGYGAAIGGIVAMMSWRGNHTAGLISVFPDAVTFLWLAGLISLAVGAELRRRPDASKGALWRSAMTVAAGSGLVFGSAVALLGGLRFYHPTPGLLAFSFLTAFTSSLVCGAVAAVGWSSKRGGRPNQLLQPTGGARTEAR